jgi:hypothetical protein
VEESEIVTVFFWNEDMCLKVCSWNQLDGRIIAGGVGTQDWRCWFCNRGSLIELSRLVLWVGKFAQFGDEMQP